MTADVQRELAEVLHRHESGSGWDGCTACTARIVALLPTVQRLIADAEERAAAAARAPVWEVLIQLPAQSPAGLEHRIRAALESP